MPIHNVTKLKLVPSSPPSPSVAEENLAILQEAIDDIKAAVERDEAPEIVMVIAARNAGKSIHTAWWMPESVSTLEKVGLLKMVATDLCTIGGEA